MRLVKRVTEALCHKKGLFPAAAPPLSWLRRRLPALPARRYRRTASPCRSLSPAAPPGRLKRAAAVGLSWEQDAAPRRTAFR